MFFIQYECCRNHFNCNRYCFIPFFLQPFLFLLLFLQLAEGLDGDPIVIPSNDRLTALIGVLPLQLIAYELALLKGINPDTPRNLAKVRRD